MKQNPSILVVDDEQANTAHVAELLKEGGYNVATASDGFKALAACKVRLPDLILLDLYMPLMSGVDVFNRLRNEEKTKHIPVIFLKKKDEPAPKLDKQALEDNPMLTTPVDGPDVMSLVKTILREKFLRDELRKKESQLKELALVDPLTSFRNQRYLLEFLKAELAVCQRYQTRLSVVVMEPDNFKELQKAHGAKSSDSLLSQLAVVLSRQNRNADVLVRSGPSEFTMILTHTDKEGAINVAQRLCDAVSASTFTIGETAVRITVSIGITEYAAQMDVEGTLLMSHARAAMAQAHTSGGNMILIAE